MYAALCIITYLFLDSLHPMLTSCSLQKYGCTAYVFIATGIFITVKLWKAFWAVLVLFTFNFLSFMLPEKSYGDEKVLKELNTTKGLFHLTWRNNEGNSWKLAKIRYLKRYIYFSLSISAAHFSPDSFLHFVLYHHLFPLKYGCHWKISALRI